MQGVTYATNGDNLYVAGRQLVSAAEKPMVFMTRAMVEAMLRKNEKVLVSSIFVGLKSL